MTITKEELSEKRNLIVPGMEFYVPSRHVKSGQLKIKVTNVSTLNKTSCWGEYEKESVWYDVICQQTKAVVATRHLADGTTCSYWDDVLIPGKFNVQKENMSLASFIEYKFNKRLEE